MKVRFKPKVTRGFSLLAASRIVFTASRLKENLWDQGIYSCHETSDIEWTFAAGLVLEFYFID